MIEEADFNEYLRTLSALNDQSKATFRRSAKSTSRDVKKMILDELKTIEANQNKVELTTIQTWIKATKEKYKNWLARLL